jgi:hypothetical protein
MDTKVLGIGGDQNWAVELSGLNLDAGTVDDVKVFRRDGKFFKMVLTKALGYLLPMLWETLDNSGRAGLILIKIRKDSNGTVHLLLEKCKWIDENNQKVEGWRVPRTSVNNPDGRPLLEINGVPLEHFTIVLTNNARITGPVACAAVIQKWDDPIDSTKEKLITLMEAADLNDAPGLSVLAKWLIKHPQ